MYLKSRPQEFKSEDRDYLTAFVWLHDVENFLKMARVPETLWVQVAMAEIKTKQGRNWAMFSLEDRIKHDPDEGHWKEFADAFMQRFAEYNWQSKALQTLRGCVQTGTLDKYETEFEQLSFPCRDRIDPEGMKELFIQGLKTRTQLDVRRGNPRNLQEAIEQAHRAEEINSAVQRKPSQGNLHHISGFQRGRGGGNRGRGGSQNRGGSQQKSKGDIICYFCDKKGHIAKDCRHMQQMKGSWKESKEGKAEDKGN